MLPSAMDPRLHRALAAAERLRDVRVGPALDLVEHERDPVAERELRHRRGDLALHLLAEQPGRRRGLGVLRAAEERHQQPQALFAALLGPHQVRGDPEEVAAQEPLFGVGAGRAEEAEERLLRQILGPVPVAGQAGEVVDHRILVPVDQVGERVAVSRPDPGHLRGVQVRGCVNRSAQDRRVHL
jgi:hypothetical protein